MSEQGTSLAFRTQMTQAQSEYLFRLCEGHANEALNKDEVKKNMRRFPNNTLGMLAIEALTGRPAVESVALTSQAASDMGTGAVEIQKDVIAARGDEKSAQSASDKASGAADTAAKTLKEKQDALAKATTDADKTAAQKAVDDATRASSDAATAQGEASAKLKDATAQRKQLEATLQAALKAQGASSSGGAVFGNAVANKAVSDAATAQAVRDIVQMEINQSFTADVCLDYLTRGKRGEDGKETRYGNPEAERLCLEFLRATTAYKFEDLHLSHGLFPDGSRTIPALVQTGGARTGAPASQGPARVLKSNEKNAPPARSNVTIQQAIPPSALPKYTPAPN